MAGSFKHIVNEKGQFIGCAHLDNLGDAYEALEECYGMIWFLAGGRVFPHAAVEEARLRYVNGLMLSPGVAEKSDR